LTANHVPNHHKATKGVSVPRRHIALTIVLLGVMITGTACLEKLPKPGAEEIGDSLFPLAGNGGYDVQHYTIDLAVNVQDNTIAGTTTIDALATQNLSSFNLDFSALDVDSVLVNNYEVEHEYDGYEGELIVSLKKAVREGERFTAVVTYGGTPHPDRFTAGLPYTQAGWVHYEDGIYVAGQPFGAATWFPANDHPLDKATYTITITVPKPYVAISNGTLQQSIDNGDTTTYVWSSRDPMATWMVTVNIAEFVQDTATGPDGLPIRNFFVADLLEEGTQKFERLPEMIEYFSTLFGPYPFEAYGAVLLNIDEQLALESQTLALHSIDEQYSSETLIAHEVAHQWFGNSVTIKDLSDIWLNEGFATYAEGLWLEHNEGPEAFNEWAIDAYQRESIFGRTYPPPGSPAASTLFNTNVYFQGAMTLHALRLEVGDEAFFQILRAYTARYQYSNASTADFIAVAEEVSGQELDALFNAWLYAEDRPPFPTGE
jgi:aminopeptidase N